MAATWWLARRKMRSDPTPAIARVPRQEDDLAVAAESLADSGAGNETCECLRTQEVRGQHPQSAARTSWRRSTERDAGFVAYFACAQIMCEKLRIVPR